MFWKINWNLLKQLAVCKETLWRYVDMFLPDFFENVKSMNVHLGKVANSFPSLFNLFRNMTGIVDNVLRMTWGISSWVNSSTVCLDDINGDLQDWCWTTRTRMTLNVFDNFQVDLCSQARRLVSMSSFDLPPTKSVSIISCHNHWNSWALDLENVEPSRRRFRTCVRKFETCTFPVSNEISVECGMILIIHGSGAFVRCPFPERDRPWRAFGRMDYPRDPVLLT